MPKVTGPLFSVKAGGTLGGVLVYQGDAGGQRVGKKLARRDRKTGGQLGQRSAFSEAIAYWRALSAGEKASYNAVADGLGMTGYQYVLKLYMLGELSGGGPGLSDFSYEFSYEFF